jgi:uncharacterized phiE125 gp8 family phage protein
MIVQIVAPTQTDIDNILSLADAKRFIKVVGTEDDEDITSFVLTAITEAEDITNRQFANATYELYLPNFPRENFCFPKNPINEIVSIEYMDLDGNYQTIDNSTYYLYKKYEVGQIVFDVLPNVQIKRHKQAVRITFKSGYTSDFPTDLRQWLKVRVSTLFEYREELIIGTIVAKTNHVDSILQRYKIRSF